MDALLRVGNNLKRLDYSKILNNILKDEAVQKYILDLNREKQLFKDGINILGEKLRSDLARFGQVYSNNTINIKTEKGQPTNRVTLKDTGEFYSTFFLKTNPFDFTIEADTIKDGEDLQDRFPDILGLAEENKNLLVIYIQDELIPLIKTVILKKK